MRCVARRRRPRAAADREHDRGQHQRDLRPARRGRAAHHRRGDQRDRALPARAARRPLDDLRAVISHPQALRSATCSSRTRTSRARAEFDTAGAARRVRRPATARSRRSRAAPPRRPTGSRLSRRDPVRGGQRHALRRGRAAPGAVRPRRARQDVAVAGALGPHRRARRGPDAVRGARPVPHQARVAADPGGAVHVPLLRRLLGHAASEPFQAALDEIRPLTTELHVLGTYAAAYNRHARSPRPRAHRSRSRLRVDEVPEPSPGRRGR